VAGAGGDSVRGEVWEVTARSARGELGCARVRGILVGGNAVKPTLDYASIGTPGEPRQSPLAGFGMMLAVLGACGAVYNSVDGAMAYLGTFGGCATGRGEALFQLQTLAPVACGMAAVGWVMSSHVGRGALFCRTALWMGIAGWLTACVCAFG
jgi:hypothetical protein